MAKKTSSPQPAKNPLTQRAVPGGTGSLAPMPNIEDALPGAPAELSAEMQEKMDKMKVILDKFKERLLAKFEGYVLGISLAPPEKEGDRKDKINVLILVDDQDSTKMGKDELHEKLTKSMEAVATEVDPQLAIDVVLITEFWQSLYDGKYDLLQVLAVSAPVFDTGWLAAIKVCEIHKSMVLKKFEKYIACYVLGGSLVRGKANPNSDIDVYIVIDDTDVKKMTRAELKDKLRGIINDMAVQAGQMTGVQNKLSLQVYILTDFWDNIKEANPIIFTFLRDGLPLYDRGIFMPWKQLLKMGKIRPSPEAIDLYKSTGEQMLERIRFKLKDIAVEDVWYTVLTPSQAAIMLYGLPPPAPRELADVMREIFVKKEKLFSEEHVKFWEHVLKTHKDVEYGIKKNVTGIEVQDMLEKSEKYLKALGELYVKIEERREKETVKHLYESAVTIVRDVLKLEGIERSSDETMLKHLEGIVHKGVLPERYLRVFKEIREAKKEYDAGKLSASSVGELQKNAGEFFKFMVEHVQRKRSRDLDRTRIRVKYGERYGELMLLGDKVFVIKDIEGDKVIESGMFKDGHIAKLDKSDLEQLEHAMANADIPAKMFLHEQLFGELKRIFSPDVQIMLN